MTEMTKIKAYVTKYALTSGIDVVLAEWSEISPGMISYKSGDARFYQFAHGSDWHRTPKEAFDKAESMRLKKIESLKKQIKKLESLVFTVQSES